MKTAYIDTSVVIAKYKQNDIDHMAGKALLGGRVVRCISSTITLVELAAVIARQRHEILIEPEMEEVNECFSELSPEEQIHALISFILLDNPIEYYSHLGTESLLYETKEIMLFSEYSTAIMFAPKLRLKCLDTLHIAAVKNLTLAKGEIVNYFITNDREILSKRRTISELIGATCMDPETLLQLED